VRERHTEQPDCIGTSAFRRPCCCLTKMIFLWLQWYLSPWAIAFMGGLLPFGSIFIEVYYILTAYWAFKVTLQAPWSTSTPDNTS